MTALLRHLPDALIVLGLLAVAVGAGLVYLPAGLVIGGVEAVVLGAVLNRDALSRELAPPKPGPPADLDVEVSA